MDIQSEKRRIAQHSAQHKELDVSMDMNSVLKESGFGFVYGIAAGAAIVGGLHQFHSGFRSFMNKPGKVYLVCMITSFGAAYAGQQEVVRQNKAHWRSAVLAAQARR